MQRIEGDYKCGGIRGAGGIGEPSLEPIPGTLAEIQADLDALLELSKKTDPESLAKFQDLQMRVQLKITQYLNTHPVPIDARAALYSLPEYIQAVQEKNQQIEAVKQELTDPSITPEQKALLENTLAFLENRRDKELQVISDSMELIGK